MKSQTINLVIKDLPYKEKQIKAVIKLFQDKNTIPFIARYRKEMTDNLDEVEIKDIVDKYTYVEKLEERKEEVIRLIDEQDKLTEELLKKINKADKIQIIEDLYRPFKKKRETLASKAKAKGLQPLADLILKQKTNLNIEEEAKAYIDDKKGLKTNEDVLEGVFEIIADKIGDDADLRNFFRKYTLNNAVLEAKVKDKTKDDRSVYKMYYDFSEKVKDLASHRVLAINRAEKEKIIKVSLRVDENEVNNFLFNNLIENKKSEAKDIIKNAAEDAYKRFIAPAIEREIRNQLTSDAQKQAVKVFSENLFNLLLQSPLKNKVVMGFDPAYRTGCKLAIVDESGKLLKISVIYPHASSKQNLEKASKEFVKLLNDYKVDLVAIGNGTASRESEVFVAKNIKKAKQLVNYTIVSEAGASVYSASALARKEFPNLQVEERSAISIARRIQDPLAELVKVDPKSIGVGQYQHDVAKKMLDDELKFVVENAVNRVGVDINSASFKLLEYISGLNKTVANNIVKFRNENGKIINRKQLKKVSRLGAKSFEQSIGFIRVFDGENILDSTRIHPESYHIVKEIEKEVDLDLNSLASEKNNSKLNKINIDEFSKKHAVGKETLEDIIIALKEPLRDVRSEISKPDLRSDVLSIDDLKVGLTLSGTVRNVVDFGVFVDIGLDNDGLVHISKISNKFIKHPSEVLKVGEKVKVSVLDFDKATNRIQLTMLK